MLPVSLLIDRASVAHCDWFWLSATCKIPAGVCAPPSPHHTLPYIVDGQHGSQRVLQIYDQGISLVVSYTHIVKALCQFRVSFIDRSQFKRPFPHQLTLRSSNCDSPWDVMVLQFQQRTTGMLLRPSTSRINQVPPVRLCVVKIRVDLIILNV